MRGVTAPTHTLDKKIKFQLTRLMRGVTSPTPALRAFLIISTHTPHARRDRVRLCPVCQWRRFQLTRLMRGVTEETIYPRYIAILFQLTRLMRGVTRPDIFVLWCFQHFNSHASCEA